MLLKNRSESEILRDAEAVMGEETEKIILRYMKEQSDESRYSSFEQMVSFDCVDPDP